MFFYVFFCRVTTVNHFGYRLIILLHLVFSFFIYYVFATFIYIRFCRLIDFYRLYWFYSLIIFDTQCNPVNFFNKYIIFDSHLCLSGIIRTKISIGCQIPIKSLLWRHGKIKTWHHIQFSKNWLNLELFSSHTFYLFILVKLKHFIIKHSYRLSKTDRFYTRV